MDELERRLRSALTDLAAEVPPSNHPWAEQERRLTARARRARRPVLMVVVAAAVMALIAVPVTIFNLRPDTVQTAETPADQPRTDETSRSGLPPSVKFDRVTYQPQAGETILTEPVPVAGGPSGGGSASLYAFAVSSGTNNQRLLCMMEKVAEAEVLDGTSSSKTCQALNPPRPGKYVWQRYSVPGHGLGQFLYVASHPTESILVRTAAGYQLANRISSGKDIDLFMLYVPNPDDQLLAYTARDKANVTLENG